MVSPHVRESGLRNLGKFCLLVWNTGKICLWYLETWSLESGIQLKESGISLMIITKNQYLESRIHCVESRQNPRLLDSLTWGELVITSCVEDTGFFFFWDWREKSRGRVRSPGKKKPRLFLYSCVSLLTRSFKTYPSNLRLSCTLWLLRQHSIRTRQISGSASWNSFLLFIKNIYSIIISFIWERQKVMDALVKDNFPPCRRGGVWGRRGGIFGGWMASAKIVPFSKWLRGETSSFSVAEWLFIISQNILVKLSVDSARVSFYFCLKKENSNTRKLRKRFPSSRWESYSRPSEF